MLLFMRIIKKHLTNQKILLLQLVHHRLSLPGINIDEKNIVSSTGALL